MQIVIHALIIYRILIITIEIDNHIIHNNLCIECTSLKEEGEINENQQLRLYHVRNVVSYTTRK